MNTSSYEQKKLPLRAMVLALVFIIIISIVWPYLPLKDPAHYFHFSDGRPFFGILNALNVLSNIPFFVVGIFGLSVILKNEKNFSKVYLYFGLGLVSSAILTAFGSAYFHWDPTPETLVWDRIPMTIGFISIAALITADRINQKLSLYLFFVLLPLGIFSVIGYAREWVSLKPYIIVQFGTILFVLITILSTKKNLLKSSLIYASLVFYSLAKFFELKDHLFWSYGEIISGHTIKHLLAAIAIQQLFKNYKNIHAEKK